LKSLKLNVFCVNNNLANPSRRSRRFKIVSTLAAFAGYVPLSAYAQDRSLLSVVAELGFTGVLVALLAAVLIAPPGTKRLWVVIVLLIGAGSTGIAASAGVAWGLLQLSDTFAFLPYLYGFWVLTFLVLVATRIRYWLLLDRMAK
jgi:hypothetical protein